MTATFASRSREVAPVQHAQLRGRLLEGAMRVVAEHGFLADVCARVMADAQVSADEFRSHFADGIELIQAVADALSNETILAIETTAGAFVDPAKRIACGVRMYLHVASDIPLFAMFVAERGLDVAGAASLIHEHLPNHIATGNRTARFADPGTEAAIDLIAGTTLAAVSRIGQNTAPPDYPEQVAATVLRGLGVPPAQARRLVRIELPPIDPAAGSLLARARALRPAAPRPRFPAASAT